MHLDYKFETNAIQEKFKQLQAQGKSEGLTRKIAGVLQQEAEQAFENERSPEGRQWAALNPQYKKQRYAQGYTATMLQVSGNLINSLNIDYGDDFAMVGVAEAYGQYHQQGTSKMPARPFLGLGDEGFAEIQHILNNAIKRALSA